MKWLKSDSEVIARRLSEASETWDVLTNNRFAILMSNHPDTYDRFMCAVYGRYRVSLVSAAARYTVCPVCAFGIVPAIRRICWACFYTPEGKAAYRVLKQETREETNLERYGVRAPAQLPDVKARRRATNIAKYGSASPFGDATVRAKANATTRRNHGVDYAFQSAKVRAKANATLLRRHGVTNPQHLPDVEDRKRATFRRNYGVDNPMKDPSVKARVVNTHQSRYGGFTMASPKLRAKVIRTNRKRYGSDYFFASEDGKEAVAAGVLRKYGVANVMQSPTVREKACRTNMIRYGGPNPMASADVRRRVLSNSSSVKEAVIGKRVVRYQGYELFVLQKLEARFGAGSVDTQFDTEATQVKFSGGMTVLDLYLKPAKTIVEVKSDYTLLGTDAWQRKNRAIQKAANRDGIRVKYVVAFPKKNRLVVLPPEWHTWSESRIRKFLNDRLSRHG